MEDRDQNKFSWTALFFVTGISFWGFTFILKVLDATHVVLFMRVGLSFIVLGILAYLNKSLGKKPIKSKSLPSEQSE